MISTKTDGILNKTTENTTVLDNISFVVNTYSIIVN